MKQNSCHGNRPSIQLAVRRVISIRFARKSHSIKTTILFSLCVALAAGFVSACAHKRPAHAAAHAAVVERQLNEAPSTNSEAVVVQPSESATNEATATEEAGTSLAEASKAGSVIGVVAIGAG